MPWRETSPMDQRRRFVGDYYRGFTTFSELCARYGVSRRVGYKWLERYETEGPPGLRDRTRRPHSSPTATPLPVVEQLLAPTGTADSCSPAKGCARRRSSWPGPCFSAFFRSTDCPR